MKLLKTKKIAAAVLAGILGISAIGLGSDTARADDKTSTATSGVHATYRNVTDSSTNKLITWNKINSQTDYEEFLRLLNNGSEVPILLIFRDLETGTRYVIGGENMQQSEEYVNAYIIYGTENSSCNTYFGADGHEMKMYWITSEAADGTVGNAVQTFSPTADGFSTLSSGADHVVTYGSTGSFTAVADTTTADTEDFLLLVNNTKNEKQYLQCREGLALWWEETHIARNNDLHSVWTLPRLSVETLTGDTKITYYAETATDSWDSKYAISSANLKYSGSWKLGTWAKTVDSTEKSWDSCYIYQEASPVYGTRKEWGFVDMSYISPGLDYTYCVLSAQCHTGYNSTTEYSFFTASEWVSKKAISSFTGPEALYQFSPTDDASNLVLGGPRSSSSWAWQWIFQGTKDNTYYLNCGFDVYYGVEGVSLNAFGEVSGRGNANSLASDQNEAGVTYLRADWTVAAPKGNSAASLNNSIYTVSNDEVLVIPEGVQLTVEKGATLIVSGGGLLVLNGGIKNQGTIIVQKGGRILRYDSDGTAEREELYDYSNASLLEVWKVNHGASALPVFDDDTVHSWDRTSCLILDGGNLIVRSNGRIRVTNLVFGSTGKTSGASRTIAYAKGNFKAVRTAEERPHESGNGSTILNYGYILASCIVSYSNSDTTVVEGGRLDCGEQFGFDLINYPESDLRNRHETMGDWNYIGVNYFEGSLTAPELYSTYLPWTIQ